MANNRLSMRKIAEVLRLYHQAGLSHREIARSVGASPTTVGEYLRRAKLAGLSWPLPEGADHDQLEGRLFPPTPPSTVVRPAPDWPAVHAALRHKGVTLDLLWQEYKAAQPDGYRYSWFCQAYLRWVGRLRVTLRATHVPGDKLFVDYAGPTVPIIDAVTGEMRPAQIFVAVLGASNYTYCEATFTQQVPDWVGAHVRAFEFFGGVPAAVVPDNLKSGVERPVFYEPWLNATYREMATHYGVAIMPARPHKPRDKAKVEAGVLVVERWLLARLRGQRFFSLAELNRALAALLTDLNLRPFQKLPGNRHSTFLAVDAPALRPLPEQRYEYADWKLARVGIDYHIEVDRHYYSVPYRLTREQVEVRLTVSVVEVFQRGRRIASHLRSAVPGRHTTLASHMPPAHRAVVGWDADRFTRWAERIGSHTAAVVASILAGRRHPEQGFRTCLGILRLGNEFGSARLEAACARAMALNALSYRSLHSLLKHGLDRTAPAAQSTLPLLHANVRGPDYYH